MNPIRIAIVGDGRASRLVAGYLPPNYWTLGRTLDNSETIIAGRDEGSSTLEAIQQRMRHDDIEIREQHMIAPTREQALLAKLRDLESLACDLIQDAQTDAEEASGADIVYPEDAAPELDDARGMIRDAIDILTQLEQQS